MAKKITPRHDYVTITHHFKAGRTYRDVPDDIVQAMKDAGCMDSAPRKSHQPVEQDDDDALQSATSPDAWKIEESD